MVSRYLIALLAALLVAPAWAEEKKDAAPSKAMSSKTLFYRLLARKQAATVEDAIRAVSRYKGGPEELQSLAEEIAFLEKEGMKIPKGIAMRKDETLTMGTAAHLLMKMLEVKGKGLMYKWFPDNQRYAMREAQDMRIILPDSFVGQTMSGNDLVGMLVRVYEAVERQKKPKDY